MALRQRLLRLRAAVERLPWTIRAFQEVHEGRLLRQAALQTMYQGQLPRLAAVAAVVHRLRIRLPGHLPSVKDGAASMCHREVGCSGTRARVAWTLIVRPTQAAA